MITKELRTQQAYLECLGAVLDDVQERIMQEDSNYNPELDFEHVCVESWQQMWGDTSCGFGSIGGAALTNASTILVYYGTRFFCVYHAGRYAYTVTRPSDAFVNDWKNHHLLGAGDKWRERYCD